jgi:hypothetical protein
MLRYAAKNEKYATAVDIVRQIALTGRRSEMIGSPGAQRANSRL